mgnify:CR=1 FL=1
MNLHELFPTRTTIRLLDLLLTHPDRMYFQSIIVEELGVAPATLRHALQHLTRLGIVDVDARFTVKVISLNRENALVQTLQTLSDRLRTTPRPHDAAHSSFAHSQN